MTTEIQLADKHFHLRRTGLSVSGHPTFEQWQNFGRMLSQVEGATHWWIGDWVNYGEPAYGEKYSQALDETGFAYGTLRNDAWVAGRIEMSRRRDILGFAHHAEVAALEPAEQDRLLDEAEKNHWTQRELRAAKKIALPPPKECYDLVLADPPWQYDFSETTTREVERHYPTATTEEIIAQKPKTTDNAILFLWATAPKIKEALAVMDGWGFTYKTHAVWDKERIGMGYWFRGRHEILLVGVKGNASPPTEDKRTDSIFSEARREHSRKPECVYTWIEQAFPGAVKIEMYSRQKRKGWMSWGLEA